MNKNDDLPFWDPRMENPVILNIVRLSHQKNFKDAWDAFLAINDGEFSESDIHVSNCAYC